MAVKGEEIRQAKKFLENKKLSIKHMKPRLFAKVSEDLGKNFDDVLRIIKERVWVPGTWLSPTYFSEGYVEHRSRIITVPCGYPAHH